MENIYARFDPKTDRWQPLNAHLEGCADLASLFAKAFASEKWGFTAGIAHDLGKQFSAFQEKLREAFNTGDSKKQVDHSTFGAQAVYNAYAKEYGKILAYVIAGHHAGLPNGRDSDDSCLENRLRKEFEEAEAGNLIDVAFPELEKPPFMQFAKLYPPGFMISLYVRLLYSCLVDADFLDTERFISSDTYKSRGGYLPLSELQPMFDSWLRKFDGKTSASPLNDLRNAIRGQCLSAAELEPGLFSLTVPTGGGKTLSSLAFALKHALLHGLTRIIYVIPYTSIIEQTAAIFKSIFGDDQVLEHHSGFDFEQVNAGASVQDYPDRAKLASENWDAPIVVTTNVQFFESFFASRSSRCRRLHNVVNSVVILDEAQMLPVPLLLPTLELIRQLSSTYRTTFVLCTATQPALNKTDTFTQGLSNVREIADDPRYLYQVLKRAELKPLISVSDGELCALLGAHRQALCIVNTRKHAEVLFSILRAGMVSVGELVHLTAGMCPVHRRGKIREIKEKLRSAQPCRVISTSLIEAGVDIDFPTVYRSMCGLDSIIQAMGRCNREGKLVDESGRPVKGAVYVFKSTDQGIPRQLAQNAQNAENVLNRFDDPLSPDAVSEYFSDLFWLKGEALDSKRILPALEEGASHCNFPFRDVADEYRLIENDYMESVIVPYDEQARALIDLMNTNIPRGTVLRKLQQYTVQISKTLAYQMRKAGYIELLCDIWPIVTEFGMTNGVYSEETGLIQQLDGFAAVESCIF